MGVDHPGVRMSMQELMREVRRVAKATVQNSAIGRAGMRFYDGGRLTINDGGGIVITDSGYIEIDGDLTGEGDFDWSGTFKARGPWELIGTGTVTAETTEWLGDINLSGDLNLSGDFNVDDGGKITSLGIRIEGGKIYVGEGANQIVIDGATGTITVPGDNPIVLQQESGAAKVKVGTTGEISGSDSGIQMMVAGEVNRRVAVTPTEILLVGLPIDATSAPAYWLGSDVRGAVSRYPSGMGGPMGGDFDWPFSLSIVTSEYGMRVHPITGLETMHEGIDFGAPGGTDIPAASSGTVIAAGYDGSRGNYVVLSHPNNVETHYFHMESTPFVSASETVVKGQALGKVGNTGLSGGNHLHFEVHVNGVAINPRDFDPLD